MDHGRLFCSECKADEVMQTRGIAIQYVGMGDVSHSIVKKLTSFELNENLPLAFFLISHFQKCLLKNYFGQPLLTLEVERPRQGSRLVHREGI